MGWKSFCNLTGGSGADIEQLREMANNDFTKFRVYPGSLHKYEQLLFFIAWDHERKVLVVTGEHPVLQQLAGREEILENGKAKVCELNVENSIVLRKLFPFTAPRNHRGIPITMGLGDRLGLASAGHLRLIRQHNVFPVLAQQSIRELNLTGRSYPEVLAAASWAVFQEGYTKGFGADGDHLKTAAEITSALEAGFTMITLDCSDHIDNTVVSLGREEIAKRYAQIDHALRTTLETKYLNRSFALDGAVIRFDEEELRKNVLIYWQAIRQTLELYHSVIQRCGRPIDFEMSIDETLTPTSPESHFFVAAELKDGGVEVTSLAPRFCGEFQKGIDYIGNREQFAREFRLHVKIAEFFGYKISVHSGSDKFAVFPIIGAESGGKYHLKTAGTNWLEAVRLIAAQNPDLYRRMHAFAVEHLSEARKYYHIKAEVAKVPEIERMSDAELPGLMDQDDARQVLHITYGLLLLAKNNDGAPVFREAIYRTINAHEAAYYAGLEKHIGKHLALLGV